MENSKLKQYYGIKFPFTINNIDGFMLDLNNGATEKVASEILHVLLTQRGSRIRKPDFGTNLVSFIFKQNDSITWNEVEQEAIESIKRYVTGVELNSINVVSDGSEILLDLQYSVNKGKTSENNRLTVKI